MEARDYLGQAPDELLILSGSRADAAVLVVRAMSCWRIDFRAIAGQNRYLPLSKVNPSGLAMTSLR